MKTSNYFIKLPQEASIKSIQTFWGYDLITLNLPTPRQRLCPRCGSTNCVIKDGSPHFPDVSFGSHPIFLRTHRIIRKLSWFSLRNQMFSWPLCTHSGMIKLERSKSLISMRCKMTVKTLNYFTKLSLRKHLSRVFKLSRTVISLPFSVLENARVGKKICL